MSIRSNSADGEIGGAARVVLRPIGNPLPMGFLALAAGTLLLSGLQLGWLRPTDGKQVALALIAVVFPLQLVSRSSAISPVTLSPAPGWACSPEPG